MMLELVLNQLIPKVEAKVTDSARKLTLINHRRNQTYRWYQYLFAYYLDRIQMNCRSYTDALAKVLIYFPIFIESPDK